ncbi:hypothetical protein BaRGS_00011032 [Batillaria attramentaria]|uniref:Uncharacterized protein n=1 Tax=Batillaria attramentaria TaxID=370345 RepID=A0ABD0LF10_9CAEN
MIKFYFVGLLLLLLEVIHRILHWDQTYSNEVRPSSLGEVRDMFTDLLADFDCAGKQIYIMDMPCPYSTECLQDVSSPRQKSNIHSINCIPCGEDAAGKWDDLQPNKVTASPRSLEAARTIPSGWKWYRKTHRCA